MKKRIVSIVLALCVALTAAPAWAAKENVDRHKAVKAEWADVVRRCSGHTEYLDKFGVTRAKLVQELSSHEHDSYYLGTPVIGGDWQSPNGDCSYNGWPGMNCAGFVGYVLRKSGLDASAALNTIFKSPTWTRWGSGLPWDGLSSASNYISLVEYGNLVSYVYPTRDAMLAGGKAEKGDLVLRFWTDVFEGGYNDNHLMIFWGDRANENKVWQSSAGSNHIGPMTNDDASFFILIKFAPEKPKPKPTFAGFTDVKKSDWFSGAVQFVKDNGHMSGIGDSLFAPEAAVTRAQAAQVLYNMAGRPGLNGDTAPFRDIQGHWGQDAVIWAYKAGVARGTAEDQFSPDSPVTREQMALFFRQFKYFASGASEPVDISSLENYFDAGYISPWALEGMAWALQCGLLSGKGDRVLDPQGLCTRAQLAQLIWNFSTKCL